MSPRTSNTATTGSMARSPAPSSCVFEAGAVEFPGSVEFFAGSGSVEVFAGATGTLGSVEVFAGATRTLGSVEFCTGSAATLGSVEAFTGSAESMNGTAVSVTFTGAGDTFKPSSTTAKQVPVSDRFPHEPSCDILDCQFSVRQSSSHRSPSTAAQPLLCPCCTSGLHCQSDSSSLFGLQRLASGPK